MGQNDKPPKETLIPDKNESSLPGRERRWISCRFCSHEPETQFRACLGVGGPHDKLRQEPQGSSPGFECAGSDSDPRVPAELGSEKSGILWTWEALSELHWVCCNGRGPHDKLRQESQGSSPGFECAGSDSDPRVPAELGQESQASSCVEEWNSA